MFRKKQKTIEKNRNLLELLLMAIAGVIILHLFWQIMLVQVPTSNLFMIDITHRFGLDDELSVPTWLVSIMAFMMAGLAWLIARAQADSGKKGAWYLIALAGILISVDEVAALHELALQGLHILAQFGEGQSFLNNAWLLLLPFIVAILVFVARYLRKTIPDDTFKSLMIAGAVYLSGALVVEYLSIPIDKSTFFYKTGPVVLEESLELIGVWLVIRALLQHITTHETALRKKILSLMSV